jgi:hypothetical protein
MSQNAKYMGFLGTVCLQVSAVPALIQAIQTGETAPAASIILVLIGLIACLIQEIHVKLWAYVIGSAIGIIGQAALLVVIFLKD